MTRPLGVVALAVVLAGLVPASRADTITYVATLTGLNESPPNASPGTGFAEVDIDFATQMMRVQVTFSGLTGNTTASHIHAATAVPGVGTAMVATQVPTFTGFPLGVTSGTYDHTFDLTLASTYNPAFVTAHGGTVASAEAFFLDSLADGTAYLNVHSTAFPGGEIRGFLQAVPEPTSVALLLTGAGGLFVMARRRRKAA